MSYTSTMLTALAALAGTSAAHIIMANPVPYSHDSLDNSPLTSANYPCKVSGDAAKFYSTNGISNTVAAGGSLKMSFKGSAVHGGGSCQIALTTDMQPSASTRWSTILSIEGGCPSKDGSSASTYDIKIPESIPAGKYSFAWTWISKMSGTQEYYMNCAPLTVTGGKKIRSEANETEFYNDFAMTETGEDLLKRAASIDSVGPPLGVFNLAEINSCKSTLSSTPIYPVPGSNVQSFGSKSGEAKISGSNCFAKGVTFSGSSGGGSSAGDASDNDSGSGHGSAPSPASGSGATESSDGFGTGSGSSAAPSGFATSITASVSAAPAATSAAPSASASSSGFATSVVPASPSASVSASAPAAPVATGSGSDSGSSSGSCTEGAYKCISSTSYQRCAAGAWSTTMTASAGWSCSGSNLVAGRRRSIPEQYLRGIAAARRYVQ